MYGRHMTDDECSPIECCVRQFNYPPKGMTKSLEDAGKLGIRTFFNSNVCAAYRRRAYLETEGFGKTDDCRRGYACGEKTSGKGLAGSLCAGS